MRINPSMRPPVSLIPLIARDGSVRGYTLVDTEDAAWLRQWKWNLAIKKGKMYVMRCPKVNGKSANISMAREILGLPRFPGRRPEVMSDHINLDTLDNRRSNLRAITNSQNSQNKARIQKVARRGQTSQYRGVSLNRRDGNWRASGNLGGQNHHVGYFATELEAAAAASAWRREHMPYSVEDQAS